MNFNSAPVYTISSLMAPQTGGKVAPASGGSASSENEYKILKYVNKIQKVLERDPSRASRITDPLVRSFLGLN